MSEADNLLKQSLALGAALNKIKKKPSYGQKIFRKLILTNNAKASSTPTAPNTPNIQKLGASVPTITYPPSTKNVTLLLPDTHNSSLSDSMPNIRRADSNLTNSTPLTEKSEVKC